MDDTVAAACRGEGLTSGWELYSIQAQLASQWQSADRYTRALALLHELLSTGQVTELVFVPPRFHTAAAAARTSSGVDGWARASDFIQEAKAKAEGLLSALEQQTLGPPPASPAPRPSATRDPTPEVMKEFRDAGPLGIDFESRGADTCGGLTVVGVEPGSAAEAEGVEMGSVALAANGLALVGVPFMEALGLIKQSERPLVLALRPPEA